MAARKKKKSLAEYLVAGGVAGMVARTCVAPIERVKILYQIQSKNTTGSVSYFEMAPKLVRNEGILSLWKGNTAAVIRVIPYTSIQFASYEIYKENLSFVSSNAASSVIAGSLAGLTGVVSTYPLDTVRARMALQMERGGAPGTAYSGVLDALFTIGKEEGVAALYRGLVPTMMGVAPYAGLKFGTYEIIKQAMRDVLGVEEKDLPAYLRVAAGSSAGLFALTFIYPFDVIRRRFQTHKGGAKYPSVWAAFSTIIKEEGITTGLYRGLSLNYIKTLPNVAIYMSLYDLIKLNLFS
mmetsp:Transcript_13684/g.22378  ORF Transcript_13684/g.22378 Transcript_13684/m.22378 type:complete len:295 (-) Transcript_13684:25-909(-)